MPRKGNVPKRVPSPDPVYNDTIVSKFINNLMRKGKKTLAENIFYKSVDLASQKLKEEPLDVFHKALKNVTPLIEVKPRRVGGATYQVPTEVREERGVALAMRWMISSAKKRNGRSMVQKLSSEIMDAYNKTGSSVKKREDTHKMAEANRAFAHYSY